MALGSETRVAYRTTDAEGKPLLPSLMVPLHNPEEQIPRNIFSKDQNGNYPIPLNSTQVNELAALEFAETIQGKASDKLPKVTSAAPPLLDQAIVAAVAARQDHILLSWAGSGGRSKIPMMRTSTYRPLCRFQ